jgi:hypothetical protein
LTNDVHCQFDFHLILNALSFVNLETYQASGRESAVVLLLSDYIKSEYGIARGQPCQCGDNCHWQRCEAVLRLSAALQGLDLRLSHSGGAPDRACSPPLARLLPAILKTWMPGRGSHVEIHFEFGVEGVRVAGRNLTPQPRRTDNSDYLASALRMMREQEGLPGALMYVVRSQDEHAFEFDLHRFP